MKLSAMKLSAMKLPAMKLLALVALVIGVLLAPDAYAQDSNHAGIYVSDGDEVASRCVAFDEEEITGVELLQRADLSVDLDVRTLGTAVCRIDGTGCGTDDCFCEYPTFWGYWTRGGDEDWTFSEVGASERTVTDGSVDGWSYGKDGEPAPPAAMTFDEICEGTQAVAATPEIDDTVVPTQDYLPFVAMGGLLGAFALLLALRRRRPAR